MPDFEQNHGTNLKLKSASCLGTERSKILNNGSTQSTYQTIVQQVIFSGCL